MIYLIDGHNLIGQLPDIDLADPNDEEKLVRKLQGWVRQGSKRRAVVYFDPGQDGGWGDLMGGGGVTVHFARMGQIADTLIIQKVKKVNNPPEYTVVTSDRAIIREVKRRRMGYILAEEFAIVLSEAATAGRFDPDPEEETSDQEDEGAAEEVELSEAEVKLWLKRFENAPRPSRPQPSPPPSRSHPTPSPKQPLFSGPPPTADELKEGIGDVSDHEVAEWLTVFGAKPAAEKPSQPTKSVPKRKKGKLSPTRSPAKKNSDSSGSNEDDSALSPEEVEEWLALFNNDDQT